MWDVLGWPKSFTCFAASLWCPHQTELFDFPFGVVFFWMLCFSNVFVAILMISVFGGLISRLRSPAWWLARTWTDSSSSDTPFAMMQKQNLGKTPLTVLLPCYLPNEQYILNGTITHLMEALEYDYAFTLIVCYNTPSPLPYETTLRQLDGKTYPNGRTLKILKVEGSKSKAENLNEALRLVDTELLVIYDADHHPDPPSLLIASAHMLHKNCSCVQGSTYLRERPNLLASYINAEFFVTHFVFFPAMEFISSLGVFGGSNALWRTEDLRHFEFRHDVQTEDIELSTRAMLGGKVTISFCPECRSGELPPATFLALYKQRLRWALGWDQVTLQHMSSIWKANIHAAQKWGLYYLLPLRWALLFSATLNALITPLVSGIWTLMYPEATLGGPIDDAIFIAICGFAVASLALLINILIHEPPRLWPAVLFFQLSGVLYIGWQLLLVLISLAKIFTGSDGGWEVTTRSAEAAPACGGDGGNCAAQQTRMGSSSSSAPSSPIALAASSPLNAAFTPLGPALLSGRGGSQATASSGKADML